VIDPITIAPAFIRDPDQSNCQTAEVKFILTRPIGFASRTKPIPNTGYKSEFLEIQPFAEVTRIELSTGFKWDGPDFHGAQEASAYHDALYSEVEDIAKEWEWSVKNVLQWANDVFNERMDINGTDFAVREICYGLVNTFGYPYHEEHQLGFWTWAAGELGDRLSTPAPTLGNVL